jgi:hypothetical protein
MTRGEKEEKSGVECEKRERKYQDMHGHLHITVPDR